MDTIGYAIEEMVYLPSEMRDALGSEEPKWKKRTKIVVFTVLGIIFVLFTGYQCWLTISSYQNPAWSSYKSDLVTTPFPEILLCPSKPVKRLTIENAGCVYLDTEGTLVPGSNYSVCSWRQSQAVDSKLLCVNFNYDQTAIADSPSSYLVVYAGLQRNQLNDHDLNPPRRNGSDHIPAFQLPLLLYVYDPGTEYSDMKPSAMISAEGTSYVMLSRIDFEYLNGTKSPTYTLSLSSAPSLGASNTTTVVYISFTSLKVTVWSQYVAHDWITSSGIIAGLIGFLRSCWYIAIIIVDRLHKKWEKADENPDDTDQEL